MHKYCWQQLGAMKRGIEWQFTFESWMAWWGEDLDKRGRGADDLCMMRIGDVGPYSPENCRKGTTRQNCKSRGWNTRTKRTIAAHKALQAEIDATPAVAHDGPDDIGEDAQWIHENVGWGSHKPSIYD